MSVSALARSWRAPHRGLRVAILGCAGLVVLVGSAVAETPPPKPKPKPKSAPSNAVKPANVLLDTDFPCELRIDTEVAGSIDPGAPLSLEMTPGEHLLFAKARGEDAEWRQVIQAKAGERKAVVIELRSRVDDLRKQQADLEALRRQENLELEKLELQKQQIEQAERHRREQLEQEKERLRKQQLAADEQARIAEEQREEARRATLPAAEGFVVRRTDNYFVGNERGMLLSVSFNARNLQGRNLLLFATFQRGDNGSKQGWVSQRLRADYPTGPFENVQLFMPYSSWAVLPGRDYSFSFSIQVQDEASGTVYGTSGPYGFTFSLFKGSR